MSFNPGIIKQTVEVTFSRKRCSSNYPSIFFNDTLVKKVQKQKNLGLFLDSTLSISTHIKSVVSKARQGIGMLKALSKYVPRHTLDGIYKFYIRPHLDYGDVVYHIPHAFDDTSQNVILDSQMEKLESVQYSVALAVTNAWKGTFGVYDLKGISILTQLRAGRSTLNYHKFKNNFRDTLIPCVQ